MQVTSTHTEAADTTVADTAADTTAQRAIQIDQLAQKLHQERLQAEQRKPPEQRTNPTVLWRQAHREARTQVRNEVIRARAKEATRKAATNVYADVRAAVHRNRQQLAPWLLAAPYAATGEAAHLLATYGSGSPLGMSAVLAATSAGASYAAWRRRLASRIPTAFRAKAQAGLGGLCGWTAAMPLVPPSGQAGMWLSLIGGTAYLGLSWWRKHDHPIPLADDVAAVELPAVDVPSPASGEDDDTTHIRVHGIIQAWHGRLARKGGPIEGSTLTYVGSNTSVDEYEIQLDRDGSITREHLRQKQMHARIALATGVLENKLSFEDTDDPARIIMRHLVKEPSTSYDGPIVLCDGKPIHSRWEITPGSTVDIVYGHYLDGRGHAAYRVIDAGSVNSMFVLGGTGSGKTKLLECLAIGLRFIGAVIWYIDGQGGASSAALDDHAHRRFQFSKDDPGDDPGEDQTDQLATMVNAAMQARNRELRERRELRNRYTYDPARPPIIVLLEEAHEVFCKKQAGGGTYGEVFGQFGQQTRKLGVGFVAASQDFDLTSTFGGSARLRSALLAGSNFAAMRLPDKSRIGMLPASTPALDTIPPKGYGFSPFSARESALWRTANLDASGREPGEWMADHDPAELDAHVADAIGHSRPTAPAAGSTGAGGAGASGADGPPRVVRFPAAAATTVDELTDGQRRALAALGGDAKSPTTLAELLGITRQGAAKHLDALVAKRRAVKLEDGRYMAR
ncbi:MarR family transcriptional regulator [Amycolatopsis arida]|uniref:MarR family transcriptional regulator n=1 Tax=Amycolatopsis arida TaxID=587909 RepID=UPI001065BC31|nr:helix-turn-helix domain-containing protein [Amycolatopsis arida]TDX84967.1 hypothetical protein CLV69_11751 [Amycolatopsis arida]